MADLRRFADRQFGADSGLAGSGCGSSKSGHLGGRGHRRDLTRSRPSSAYFAARWPTFTATSVDDPEPPFISSFRRQIADIRGNQR
jgi:hypothetical protein